MGQGALTFEREQAPTQHPQAAAAAGRCQGGFHSRGTQKALGTLSPRSLRGNGSPATGSPPQTTHHMSCFPTSPIKMPSGAGGQAQGGKFPTRSQARLAPCLHRTHCCPPARGAGRAPPCWPGAPGCFLPAHDLPDLLNKPPGSSKPTAFLEKKVVKGSMSPRSQLP